MYAPAVQIDSALLLLVGGLAAVILPKSALAHAAGDAAAVKRYYVKGTLVSLAVLIGGAATAWGLSPWIFPLWLGNPMEATRAILPLVLIHTVVGGSSAVGRSVLLAAGKVKAFTIAALAGGAANVILGFVFVRYLGWGLPGIVLATIIAVTARCAIWMPWYTWRVVRRGIELEWKEEAAPIGA